MSTKTCSRCHRDLPLEAFHRLRGKYRSQCKECRSEARRTTRSPPGHRTCARCRQALPLESFYSSVRAKDGKRSWCISCERVSKASATGADPEARRRLQEQKRAQREAAAQAVQATGMKSCCDCGEVKPVADFTKNKASLDGWSRRCKPCRHRHRNPIDPEDEARATRWQRRQDDLQLRLNERLIGSY